MLSCIFLCTFSKSFELLCVPALALTRGRDSGERLGGDWEVTGGHGRSGCCMPCSFQALTAAAHVVHGEAERLVEEKVRPDRPNEV